MVSAAYSDYNSFGGLVLVSEQSSGQPYINCILIIYLKVTKVWIGETTSQSSKKWFKPNIGSPSHNYHYYGQSAACLPSPCHLIVACLILYRDHQIKGGCFPPTHFFLIRPSEDDAGQTSLRCPPIFHSEKRGNSVPTVTLRITVRILLNP